MITVPTTGQLEVRGGDLERELGAVARRRPNKESSTTGEISRSQSNRTGQGTVVAALVSARLLGLKVLTLDAQMVLAPADAALDPPTVVAQAKPASSLVDRPATAHPEGQRADLAYAVRLLEESSKSLDVVRAMQRPA
jgi:hypothetical protein